MKFLSDKKVDRQVGMWVLGTYYPRSVTSRYLVYEFQNELNKLK